jgi:hypothetical protein
VLDLTTLLLYALKTFVATTNMKVPPCGHLSGVVVRWIFKGDTNAHVIRFYNLQHVKNNFEARPKILQKPNS